MLGLWIVWAEETEAAAGALADMVAEGTEAVAEIVVKVEYRGGEFDKSIAKRILEPSMGEPLSIEYRDDDGHAVE